MICCLSPCLYLVVVLALYAPLRDSPAAAHNEGFGLQCSRLFDWVMRDCASSHACDA